MNILSLKGCWFLFLFCVFSDAMASYNDGLAAYSRGDYTQAYNKWLKVVKNDGNITDSFDWKRNTSGQVRDSQYGIGLLYWQGKGVEQDYKKAAHWLKKSAKAGQRGAQLKLGYLYLNGLGEDKNEVEARTWFLKAAESGAVEAQYNMAQLLLNGIGGKKDDNEAKYWLKKAAKTGDADAVKLLQSLQGNDADFLPRESHEQILEQKVVKTDYIDTVKLAPSWQRKNAGSPPRKSQAQISEQTVDTNIPVVNEVRISQIHGPEWLLTQDSKGHALQIIAMTNRKSFDRIAKGYLAEGEGEWVYFVKSKGGKKYYILLRCCFPSKKLARKAINNFQPSIKSLNPFLVKIDKVQSLMADDVDAVKLAQSLQRKDAGSAPRESQAQISEQTVDTNIPEGNEVRIPRIHGPEWLLTQDSKGHALQIIAMTNRKSFDRIAKGYLAEGEGEWVYFVKSKGGKKYYILLRCCFPNKKLARKAINNFQPSIKSLNPFLVKLDKVQSFVRTQ